MAGEYIKRINGDFQLLPVQEYFFDDNGNQYTKKRSAYVKPADLTYDSLDNIDYSYWDGTGERPKDYGHYRVVRVNDGTGGVAYYLVPIYSTDIKYKPLEPIVEEPVLHITLTSEPAKRRKKKLPPIIRDPRIRRVGGDGTAEITIPGDPELILKIIRLIYKEDDPPVNPPGTYLEYEAPPVEPPGEPTILDLPVQLPPEEPEEEPSIIDRILGRNKKRTGDSNIEARPETRRLYAYKVNRVHRYHIPVEIVEKVLSKVDELNQTKDEDVALQILTYLRLQGKNVGDTLEEIIDHYISKSGSDTPLPTFVHDLDILNNVNYITVLSDRYSNNGYTNIYYDDSDSSSYEVSFGENDNMINANHLYTENHNWTRYMNDLEIANNITWMFSHPNSNTAYMSYTVNFLRLRGYTDDEIKAMIYDYLKHTPVQQNVSRGSQNLSGRLIWDAAANVYRLGGRLNYLELF